jgi:cytochrome o ubiquinol oxidase subunit 3
MHDDSEKTIFGFWVYLMTDCVLFASLFATYAVLHNNTFGGPSGKELFSLSFVLIETMLLLTSSYTCGLAMLAVHRQDKKQTINWLRITAMLGLLFLLMEFTEFRQLAIEGHSWRSSGFMSAFYTLVGTHGLHISVGLLWMSVMIKKVKQTGLKTMSIRRLKMLSLFWHFLDVVWIFIFSIVYLMGKV